MRSNALPRRRQAGDLERLALATALGLSIGYAGALAAIYVAHTWLVDSHGHRIVEDFAAFWTAGREALRGTAAAVYDVPAEHAAEVATIGHPFGGTLGWSYPPLFLFVAALLACLPYIPAFFLWGVTTLAAYASVTAAIAERSVAFLAACAAPWVLLALMPGQNGFLTAALIGGAMLCLESRPMLAGLLLGLLSYKPQFGILFPLALAFGGYWRAFAWACMATLLLNGAAVAVFGFGTLDGFLHSLSSATQSHLAHSGVGWKKLQSIYGLMRSMSVPGSAAWAAQAIFSVAVATGVVFAWRSAIPYPRKAAILAAASLLVTPYVFAYDFPVLAVACAFLFRDRGFFDRTELSLLLCAVPCLFGFLWIPVPTAFFASLVVGIVAARRALSELPAGWSPLSASSQSTGVCV